jgi:hypothetical protein
VLLGSPSRQDATRCTPSALPGNIWIGPGSGKDCSGCGEPVKASEPELERDDSGALTFRFHTECYEAWLNAPALAGEHRAASEAMNAAPSDSAATRGRRITAAAFERQSQLTQAADDAAARQMEHQQRALRALANAERLSARPINKPLGGP